MAIITLTTDFGTRDGYVGAVKGVLCRQYERAGNLTIVDIAHDIPRGDIAHAAWVLATSTMEFPHGTIHVVVVDPGVGGSRKPVIVKVSGQWYVGPDNGVFAYVADVRSDAWVIEARHFRARRVSPTFHGRDVFAHAAAALARGEDVLMAGPAVRLTGTLPWGSREQGHGRIVHVDHYGNLISDLPAAEAGGGVQIVGRTLPLVGTYEDVPSGELLAYIGSHGTIEIGVRDGRADAVLDAPRGTAVEPAKTAVPYR
ncbi:MAG TPA: SAM-dependent chlorinase/fluorinase [Kofleriaceae bacterium]|nr:SAM-dependent chlorinase/fluorinase [Kofleriaceae bacterium]